MTARKTPRDGERTLTKTEARLQRILEITPFVTANPGIGVDEVCERFDVDRDTLVADLELLFMCGLPPYSPSDLFEVEIEDDQIWLTGAESLSTRFGMARHEAARLLTAGELAAELPGVGRIEELETGIAKLHDALGDAPVAVSTASGDDARLAGLRAALVDRRRVHIEYWTYARDEVSSRVVEPGRLFTTDGNWYLSAYCLSADAPRTFRVDRIRSLEVLDTHFDPRDDRSRGIYEAAPEDLRAVVRLARGSGWVTERYPVESVDELDSGETQVVIAASAEAFLIRLVISLGGDAEVVDPPWLRDAVRARACELLRRSRQVES